MVCPGCGHMPSADTSDLGKVEPGGTSVQILHESSSLASRASSWNPKRRGALEKESCRHESGRGVGSGLVQPRSSSGSKGELGWRVSGERGQLVTGWWRGQHRVSDPAGNAHQTRYKCCRASAQNLTQVKIWGSVSILSCGIETAIMKC